MAVLRQANLLGSQRVDVPHLRALESATAADFDVVAGRVQAGGKALVIRGFELGNFSAGTATSNVQLNTADGVLYNQNATESGTFLWVPLDRPVEVLDSALNPRVDGSFVASAVNYIGIDLTRQTDVTTTDHVKFLDANTLLEQGYEVPLARTLDYRIVITSTPFSALPHLTPIAKVTSNANNQVVSVEDARNIMWRLGSGGDFPQTSNSFAWPQDRVETAGAFSGGDKGILSQKDWQDAVMSRVWEIGGGENWYSPTADRNVKLAGNPSSLFTSTADNFEWLAGLYTVNHLHWKGLKFLFDNANTAGVYYNTITDQLVDDPAGSAATSKTSLAVGDCLYVDLDRSSNATLVAQKAAMQTLGEPVNPGSRVIIAWRNADGVFRRDGTFAVNTSFAPATTVAIGAVRLAYAAGTPGTPTVLPLDANNTLRIGEGSYLVSGANPATYSFSASGYGVHGQSTTSSGVYGSGSTIGVEGESTVSGAGIYGHSAATNSTGVMGCGIARGLYGGPGTTGNTPVTGAYCEGSTAGVEGFSTATGVWGHGGTIGCYGSGSTHGVQGFCTGTSGDRFGVRGEAGGTGAGDIIGVYGTGPTYGVQGNSSGTALYGSGGDIGCYGSGNSYGVQGNSSGTALYGSGGTIGVYGNGSAFGVQGVSAATALYGSGGVVGVDGTGSNKGLAGLATGTGGDRYGVYGVASGTGGGSLIGVYGEGATAGVHGVGAFAAAGVWGSSTDGVGGVFEGNATRAPINLGWRTAAPTSGVAGDMYLDSSDGPGSVVMHVCVTSGTPGTWKQIIFP